MDRSADGAHRTGAHRGIGHSHHGLRGVLHHPRVLALWHAHVEQAEAGWTFVEVLIVIAIILILTSGVGFMAFRYIAKARQVTAKSQIETLCLALNAYAQDCLQYPTEMQGMEALWTKPTQEPVPKDWEGPYITKKITTDPWGHDYEYTVPGPNGLPFGLRSFGQDGNEGGDGNDKDYAAWED